MAKKPTYEELEQRVKELEKEAIERKQAKEERGKGRKTEPFQKAGMLQEKETMPEKNILIADDDQVILDILKEMIQREGYRVFLASNGKEAVEAIKINPIDLAILDIKMPVMDGIEALEEIKKINQGIEVLIMTGYANLETLTQAISDYGAFDYILKPFKRADILNGIQNALLKRDFASQKKLREKELEERIIQLGKEFHERTHHLRESQIKYRDIVENSNDAIVVVQDEKLKFANTKTVELTGYRQEELITMSFLEMVHPEDRDMVAESYKSEDFPNTFSFRALRKSGDSLWVEINTVRATWEKRQATLNVIRDISERKRAEEALLESEKRYRTLFESSRDAIVVLTPEKKFLQGNPAAIKMFACADEKEFISHTVEDLSPEYQLDGTLTSEKTEQMMKIAIEEGSHFFEWKHKRIDGTEFFATVLLTKMETKNKIVMQATVRDITERKQAAEQLSRHIEQINKHKLALQKLAKMDFADLDAAIKSATEEASQTLGADRVCVWFFNEGQSEMVCQDLYQLSHDSHEKGLTLKSKDYPNYFRVLKEKGTIAADDAQNDPSTNELTEGYLKPLGITSRLSVAIFLQSDLVGGVSAEHTGPLRKWSEEEQTFLISIADVVILALEIARRQQAELELKKHKYRLEELVEERTAELKEEISGRKKTEEELQRNVEDLERFSKLAVGREERMIKLKKEINEVLRGLGQPDKYKIVD